MALRRNTKKDQTDLYDRLPAELAAVVRDETIDLTQVSPFCRKQAECTPLFEKIVQIQPGIFALRPPFRENFIKSLHAYIWPNAQFSPQETVANALLRHAKWYLSTHDTDTFRANTKKPIVPRLLRPNFTWIEGIVRPNGEFTTNSECEGEAAILVWQDSPGDPPAIAIEICGLAVGTTKPAFRLRLLESMLECLSIALELKRPTAGRPVMTVLAESAAYQRDHLRLGRAQIAKALCSCGGSRHTQKCFDRLNKLADGFYRNQRNEFTKLVREQARKYSEIKS